MAQAQLREQVQTAVTESEALAILANNERLFSTQDVPAILSGFSDQVVVRFADQPEIRGKAALEKFLRARFTRQSGYRLSKTLRCISGNLIVGTWTGNWVDAQTGQKMQGRGTELLYLVGGLCAEWDATFNVWPEGGQPALPLT